LWWVGLDYNTFKARGATSNNGAFRYDKWFGVTQKEALLELGAGDALGVGSTAAQVLSDALGHLRSMAAQLAISLDLKAEAVFRPYTLARGLKELAGSQPQVPEEILSRFAAGNVLNGYVRTAIGRERKQTVVFSRPRLAYALDILNTRVPTGHLRWTPPDSHDSLAAIRKADRPILADVTVTRAAPKQAGLYGLCQNDRAGGMPRTTATHPELLALDAFAALQVHTIWAGDGYIKAIDTLPMEVRSFLRDPGCSLSWSAGIIGKELVRGIIGPDKKSSGSPSMSWCGLWLKAADRVNGYNDALALSKQGFHPVAYGSGRIEVLVPDDPKMDILLLLAALQQGYLPAAGAYAPHVLQQARNGSFGQASPPNGWGPGAFIADAIMLGRGDLIRMANGAPLMETNRQKKLFTTIAKEMRQRA
jgi:hypothetical protein